MQFTGLKQRVHAGERIFRVAVSCPFDRSRFQEILRPGPYNEQRRVEFCGMAEEHGVHVQFRIRHTRHTYAIGDDPDPGPCGVLLPQTGRGSTVAEALRSFHYPPGGRRSYGGAARRGAGEGSARSGVLRSAVEPIRGAVSTARVGRSRHPGARSGQVRRGLPHFWPIDPMFSFSVHRAIF